MLASFSKRLFKHPLMAIAAQYWQQASGPKWRRHRKGLYYVRANGSLNLGLKGDIDEFSMGTKAYATDAGDYILVGSLATDCLYANYF